MKLPNSEKYSGEVLTSVALLHLKKLCSRAAEDPIRWNYDRPEVIADGIVHALGVSFGLVGVIALFLISATSTTVDTSVVAIYAVGLLTMLVLSATYNLWPVSPRTGRFDKLSIALYLAMGWSGAMVYDKAAACFPGLIIALIAAGGALYTIGVLFHSWERLRFQNAIWHGFVILGAGCHFAAVVGLVTA
jgi:hemolysin III